jgi:hypothetical protein
MLLLPGPSAAARLAGARAARERPRAGILASLDGYMNIALEQTEVSGGARHRVPAAASRCCCCQRNSTPHRTVALRRETPLQQRADRAATALLLQEYVNGQLKNKYGDAFIRGNNGECSREEAGSRALACALRAGAETVGAAAPQCGARRARAPPAAAHAAAWPAPAPAVLYISAVKK